MQGKRLTTKIPRLKIPVMIDFLEDINLVSMHVDIVRQSKGTYCFHGSLDFSNNGTEKKSIKTSDETLKANDIIRWCPDVSHCAFTTIKLVISV